MVRILHVSIHHSRRLGSSSSSGAGVEQLVQVEYEIIFPLGNEEAADVVASSIPTSASFLKLSINQALAEASIEQFVVGSVEVPARPVLLIALSNETDYRTRGLAPPMMQATPPALSEGAVADETEGAAASILAIALGIIVLSAVCVASLSWATRHCRRLREGQEREDSHLHRNSACSWSFIEVRISESRRYCGATHTPVEPTVETSDLSPKAEPPPQPPSIGQNLPPPSTPHPRLPGSPVGMSL